MGEIQEALRQASMARGGSGKAPLQTETDREPRERQFGAVAMPPPTPEPDREPDTLIGIPRAKHEEWRARALLVEEHSVTAEVLLHLAVRLRREMEARQARSLAIVSAQRQEGKTTLSCNLALALASLAPQRSVALVDLDLRKPSIARNLEIPCRVGFEDVLLGRCDLPAVQVGIDQPPLDVYPARRVQRDAHTLLGLPSLRTTLRRLEKRYELVIIDTPPVLLVPDAVMILEVVKNAVAVVRAGRSRKRALEALCKHLPDGTLVGTILNEGALPLSTKHYGYYGADADPDE